MSTTRSFTKQYQGDHIKEEEMHVTFSINEDMKNVHKIIIRTHDGKKPRAI